MTFTMTVHILGTPYTVKVVPTSRDERLRHCDGFCDKSSHLIVLDNGEERDTSIDDPIWYLKHCARHEVVHAFLFESGLHENFEHQPQGQEEMTVDWIAAQFHKMEAVIAQIEHKIHKEAS